MEHLFSVDTLNDLKKVMPESAKCVLVHGHTRPGDGGGGMFRWVAGLRVEPNNGTIIGVTTVGSPDTDGRWVRIDKDPINVQWFGAGSQLADSTSAIQAALDAAKTGGTVRVPSGIYRITRPLKCHQGTSLVGDGLLTQLFYSGSRSTGCLVSATPEKPCSFHFSGLNVLVHTTGAWAYDLRGMSFSRFDHLSIHLRKPETCGFYGPGDGQSPYYNLYTACHVSGAGREDSNQCVAFNFTWDEKTKRQGPNANQVMGGHVNSCQTAVACYGTWNVFYGQVLEQCKDGYVFGLPPDRLNDASKGTVNTITGCYTEYVQQVIVQEHESCTVTAELTHTTGYKTVFQGKSKANSVVLTSHDGRLESSRSFMHRRMDVIE